MTDEAVRIGTRASALALAQAGLIADRIAAKFAVDVELVPITSEGDRNKASLATLGGTGVFANALREALIAGRCDLLVHSFKDLPTVPYEDLRIGAVPKREDPRDTLCAREGWTLASLPVGARVGTGSPRRVAQLKALRPDLAVVDLRGNVDTRLGRVNPDDLDAVVLAAAGLARLDRLDAVTDFLDLADWPTAPGQGALAIEVRGGSEQLLDRILNGLDHGTSHLTALAERSVLARLQAGCSAPIGATAVVDGELLLLTATVYQPDGTRHVTSSHALVLEGATVERVRQAEDLGERVGDELLSLGAADLAELKTA
ncbi:hydroxymethylbilane synthase [Parafrigoribacterium mesophilum]|uniref:hydroxymethylbilane synthase n=1 Tax=Parafrigoribacterium mesophilum TaxID=433646 RepID=UPI0031FD1DD8